MRIGFDSLKFEIRLWPPRFGGYFLNIGVASAGSSFPMVHVAEAPVNVNNVDHHSSFTMTDHAAVGRLGSESFELRGSGGGVGKAGEER